MKSLEYNGNSYIVNFSYQSKTVTYKKKPVAVETTTCEILSGPIGTKRQDMSVLSKCSVTQHPGDTPNRVVARTISLIGAMKGFPRELRAAIPTAMKIRMHLSKTETVPCQD